MKTNQEILNIAASGLLSQGAKSMAVLFHLSPQCAYRGEEGRKCGAGFLIADEFYLPRLESKGARSDVVRAALMASGVDMTQIMTIELVNSIQSTHDKYAPSVWAERLRGIAKDYNLSPIAIDDFEAMKAEGTVNA